MTNIIIIFAYFIALLILKNNKNIFLFFLSIIFCIIGTKALELYQSNSYIDNEFIAPIQLSKSGNKLAIDLIPNSISERKSASSENNGNNQELASKVLGPQTRAEVENRKFIKLSEDPIKTAEWMLQNNILIDATAAFRGQFFHHYSTILQPLRELEAGNYAYGLTSQYGLVTLLPLLVLNGLPFTYYGLISLFLLLIFGVFLIFNNRYSTQKLLIITALISVIALTIDIPAIRLSPGFTYLRYFPLLSLIYLANRQLSTTNFVLVAIVGAIFALLNSIQFNLIFLFATFIGYSFIRIVYKEQSDIKIYCLPAAVLGITCLQLLLFMQQSNSFTVSLFSSVGDGLRSTSYTVAILFLPIAIKLILAINLQTLIAIKDGKFQSFSFTKSEILVFIFYPLCATYAISFAGSPQHFSGFMVLASYSIYIIFVSNIKGLQRTAIALLLLLAVPYYYGFVKISQPFVNNSSEIFEYQNVGKTLVFKTALNIDQVSKDYDDITKDYVKQGQIYFLSRDKIFIETQKNANLNPKIYDIYLSLFNQDPEIIIDRLKKDNVKYLVLNSNEQMALTQNLVDVFSAEIGPLEMKAHNRILKNLDLLSHQLRDNVLRCNMRYCIYRII